MGISATGVRIREQLEAVLGCSDLLQSGQGVWTGQVQMYALVLPSPSGKDRCLLLCACSWTPPAQGEAAWIQFSL